MGPYCALIGGYSIIEESRPQIWNSLFGYMNNNNLVPIALGSYAPNWKRIKKGKKKKKERKRKRNKSTREFPDRFPARSSCLQAALKAADHNSKALKRREEKRFVVAFWSSDALLGLNWESCLSYFGRELGFFWTARASLMMCSIEK